MCETSEQICKHTPGPWGLSDETIRDGLRSKLLHGAPEGMLAIIRVEHQGGYYGDGNARLISAAPELLAELKAVREQCLFDDDGGQIGVSEDVVIPSDMFDRICAAINKAEGRS